MEDCDNWIQRRTAAALADLPYLINTLTSLAEMWPYVALMWLRQLNLYGVSALPTLPKDSKQVAGAVLTKSIAGITLETASVEFGYAR